MPANAGDAGERSPGVSSNGPRSRLATIGGFYRAPAGPHGGRRQEPVHLDASIPRVGNPDVAGGGHQDAPRIVETATGSARSIPLGSKRTVAIELLNAMVQLVANIQVSKLIEGRRGRDVELAGRNAKEAELTDVESTRGEALDAMVVFVDDDDLAGGLHRQPPGTVELPRARTLAAEAAEKAAVGVEHADPVAVVLGHVEDTPVRGNAEIGRVPELPGPGAEAAERHHRHVAGRELLDAMVELVGNVHVAFGIEGDAARDAELTGTHAVGAELGQELTELVELQDSMVLGVRNVAPSVRGLGHLAGPVRARMDVEQVNRRRVGGGRSRREPERENQSEPSDHGGPPRSGERGFAYPVYVRAACERTRNLLRLPNPHVALPNCHAPSRTRAIVNRIFHPAPSTPRTVPEIFERPTRRR